MKSYTSNGIKLLFFENLSPFKTLYHAVTTRTGGVSQIPFKSLNLGLNTDDRYENILANHEALSKALEFDLKYLLSSHQVHGTGILTVNNIPEKTKDPFVLKHSFDGYDAMVTDKPGITLIIRVADCVPIILFDPAKQILAVVHAGWKGTKAEVAAKTVRVMVTQFGSRASDIIAGIGPSIGPCCFNVQKDVADLFFNNAPDAEIYIKKKGTGFVIDLREANRSQLIAQGCGEKNIEVSDLCTSCNSNLFFSHRGEKGKTGRNGLLAGLRARQTFS
jgi:hypothetical protein